MREVDFLPSWYAGVRRTRLQFRVQVWATIAVATVVGLFLLTLRARVATAQASYQSVSFDLSNTRAQVKELDQLMQLQQMLLSKQKLVGQLGMPVELTRVISEVAHCMPAEMSLDELNCTTSDRELTVVELAGRPAVKGGEAGPRTRTLHVSLKGVAPTESQVTAFYARLADRRFLDKVQLENSSERRTGDFVMREFEVSFDVPLDYAAH